MQRPRCLRGQCQGLGGQGNWLGRLSRVRPVQALSAMIEFKFCFESSGMPLKGFSQGRETVISPWLLNKEQAAGGKTGGRDIARQMGGVPSQGKVVSGLRSWQCRRRAGGCFLEVLRCG